ncbi:MAG TPA: selenium-dependent xanthine dehydrogenase [Pirellulales bacterium]|nr:selenium-dependent xanthine dehydrogenase [Pirellulales bacterium]
MCASVVTSEPLSSASETVRFTLNGREVEAAVDDRSLLAVLREDFGFISLKNGCEPQASCGCCTLLIDGKPRLSCTMKTAQVAGKTLLTLEGLPEERRQQIAQSFACSGGVQCGFCIPGMAMRAHALTEQNQHPTREEIAHDLRAHLCRCTGYVKIVDAVEELARVTRGEAPRTTDTSGRVGTALKKYKAHDLVLGDFRYIDDITVPGQMYAAMKFSEHPRALVKGIDASAALAVAGVERVITAADVPGDRYVGLIVKDWPILVAIGEETRCVGDIIAVVVADNQYTARKAAEQIVVDYEVRTPLTTVDEALKPDAPQIHAKGNLLSKSAIVRGNPEEAFAHSAHVVEDTFQTQRIEHMFLEPEACLAMPIEAQAEHEPAAHSNGNGHAHRGNLVTKIKVLSQGQGIFDDQRQIASVLGWPRDRVDVELVQNGGAFGGKEDMSIQAQTALAAVLCGKPVKCTLTRDESFRLHPKRHAIRMHVKIGSDADGRITAVRARIKGDKGAYASVGAKVLERAAGHACGPYRVPAIDIEALAVYTNNPPCGAMRGFGANQSAFAVEQLLDRLAKQVGIDGWEIRWRNILQQGDRFATGQKLDKPFGLKETLLAVKDAYRGAKYAGIACGIKNCGIGNGMPDPGKAMLRVEPDGKVSIRTGYTEMGQGLFTVTIQTAVEETGLPPETFTALTDTAVDLDCGQTTGSRGTMLSCNAVIEAAKKLKADLDSGKTLADLIGREYRGEWICNYTHKLGAHVDEPKTHLTYGFATQVVILDDQGRIQKVIAAHDVGRVMNPVLCAGQIEGSLHMGLGYALTEDFVCEGGHIVTDTIKSIRVLRAHQMPELEVMFIETPDPECPYGARGVGELGLVPTAPAVAGALRAFDGIERTVLPMKDSPAAKAILTPGPRKSAATREKA